jgi:hypothetical protein
MAQSLNPAATGHLPPFITAPGETDVLLVFMAFVLIGSVLAVGVFYFWLHSLPERMVHNKLQYDIVALLCLLALFTHEHAFWIAGILLAFIKFPDFSLADVFGPFKRIAASVERMADTGGEPPRALSDKAKKKV